MRKDPKTENFRSLRSLTLVKGSGTPHLFVASRCDDALSIQSKIPRFVASDSSFHFAYDSTYSIFENNCSGPADKSVNCNKVHAPGNCAVTALQPASWLPSIYRYKPRRREHLWIFDRIERDALNTQLNLLHAMPPLAAGANDTPQQSQEKARWPRKPALPEIKM
jgi:hypothetical protein